MVVRLDLEGDGDPVAEVDDAGVLAGALQHSFALRRESPEQVRGVLVAAVLRPEHGEDGELEVVRPAREELRDAVELPIGEAERPVQGLLVQWLLDECSQAASLTAGSDGSLGASRPAAEAGSDVPRPESGSRAGGDL
jgi:hypothetical protein